MGSKEDVKKAVELATKIAARAESTLADLQLEMDINKWSDDIRKIMWDAVARKACDYAAACRGE